MRKAGVSGATASFRWCLVLTTTTNVQVDLRNESYGKQQQRSAHGRQEQYSRVLHHWLSTHPRVPITLVENSGDELLWAKRLAVRFNRSEQHLALVHLRPPSACRSREIGCFEAHSVHSAVKQSPQFRPRNMGGKKKAQCSHALMLTGRYAITSRIDGALRGCGKSWSVAVQNPTWLPKGHPSWRQETSAFGFEASLADEMFGWWRRGGANQERHVTDYVGRLRKKTCSFAGGRSGGQAGRRGPSCPICELPPLNVVPVREGSTGKLRASIR